MSKEDYKNIWVFIETEVGKAAGAGYGLLTPGRELADASASKLTAVVIGENIEEAAKLAVQHGADEAVIVDSPRFSHYNTGCYAYALCKLAEKYKPSALLIGATTNGRDLGPRVACRLKTGLTADCTGIGIDEDTGNVAWTRPAFGGNLMATIICADHRPQIGTVRPGVFRQSAIDTSRTGTITKEDITVPETEILTEVLEYLQDPGAKNLKLEEAAIIVSGGAGLGKPESFAILKELADALGGVLGASRAAVDSGWISHAHQVGQTGKTVQPSIYIACGISGSIQHLAGMSSSDKIIAINKDPNASIFSVADYAVVGDLFKIVPMITELVKKS